jgi:hypothetical protein
MNMKKALFVIALPMLLASQAFACDPISQNATKMNEVLSQSNNPENVQAVALRNKAMYCHQNAINLGLQGDAHTNYMTSCINKNAALEQKTALSKGQKI